MFGLVVLCALLVFVQGQSTSVSQCINSRGPLPLNAYVHGCTSPPCLLPQQQNVAIDVSFKAPHNIRKMTTLAVAILNVGGIDFKIPYDLQENANSCNFVTDASCPLLEGQIVQYRLKMFIERFFPVGTRVTVEFRIVDNERNNETIWCIRLPITIVAEQRQAKTVNQS